MRFLFIVLILPSICVAQLNVEKRQLYNSGEGTEIIYVNGQENEKDDADISRLRLEELISSNEFFRKVDSKGIVDVKNVFNRTFGVDSDGAALPDYMESLVLLLLDENESLSVNQAWSSVYQTIYQFGFIYTDGKFRSGKDAQDVLDVFDRASAFRRLYNSTVGVVSDLQNAIRKTLKEDKNLILISHSQGNLFVNVAYQELSEFNAIIDSEKNLRINDFKRRLGNLQVATPASEIEIEENEYITNTLDKISKVPFSLTPNFLMAQPGIPDPRGLKDSKNNHSFISTYISGFPVGDLVNLRNSLFQKLVDLSSRLGKGVDDCNNDGEEVDFAFETKDGGYISPDADVDPDFVIANGARVCGDSFIDTDNGNISGNVIFENSGIGNRCSFVEIKSSEDNLSLVEELFACATGDPVEGSSFVVQDSSISDSFIEPMNSSDASIYIDNSILSQADFAEASVTVIESDLSAFSSVRGRAYIQDSELVSTTYNGDSAKVLLSNGDELLSATIGTKFLVSTITGRPLFQSGKVDFSTITSFGYTDRLATSGNYYVLHIKNGSVFDSTLQGNVDISGSVKSSFVRGYSGQTYRSFLSPSSRIENAVIEGRFQIIGDITWTLSTSDLVFQNFCFSSEKGFGEFLTNGTCRY